MAHAKEIDPEELLRRKFRAKCRFRALGRLCMENTFWLIEAIDTYEGDDVKRRVEQAVRGKVKKQLLSVKDKALLSKHANDRTEHEKKYLYKIIGGLKCFKRYPNHVKRKLAEVTYFQYYGPNRVVVRQHQEAHALYFIVSGTVSVTQLIYDELLEEYVSQEIATMEAGDMFGEMSLLHSAPRTATVTTTDHCEFLQLLKADFKNVLQVCVQKQWDEIKVAMSLFTYFDALSETMGSSVVLCSVYFVNLLLRSPIRLACVVIMPISPKTCNGLHWGDPYPAVELDSIWVVMNCWFVYVKHYPKGMHKRNKISLCCRPSHDQSLYPCKSVQRLKREKMSLRECCIVAKMKHYAENDTVLGDGVGVPNHVYFILSGRVQVIELLQVIVLNRFGKKFYTLFDPYLSPEPSDEDFEKKWFAAYNKKSSSDSTGSKFRSMSTRTQSRNMSILKHSGVFSKREPSQVSKVFFGASKSTHEINKAENHIRPDPSINAKTADKSVCNDLSTTTAKRASSHKNAIIREESKSLADYNAPKTSFISPNERAMSCRFSVEPPLNLKSKGHFGVSTKLKTYFMQVCIMNTGSTFGFGENMRDRRMIALQPVTCMLIPKIWLLQHNTANIWTRIQYYLQKKIPNKQKIFEEFVKQREWEDYRKLIVQDVVSRSKTVNYTSTNDVPYSIRLEEMLGV